MKLTPEISQQLLKLVQERLAEMKNIEIWNSAIDQCISKV